MKKLVIRERKEFRIRRWVLIELLCSFNNLAISCTAPLTLAEIGVRELKSSRHGVLRSSTADDHVRPRQHHAIFYFSATLFQWSNSCALQELLGLVSYLFALLLFLPCRSIIKTSTIPHCCDLALCGKPITTMTRCSCTRQGDPLLCTQSFGRRCPCSRLASPSWGEGSRGGGGGRGGQWRLMLQLGNVIFS